MSTRDILSSLRQMHFPDCVRSALDYLASVSINKSSLCSVPAVQVEAVNSQIVSEFIFFLHVKKVSSYRRLLFCKTARASDLALTVDCARVISASIVLHRIVLTTCIDWLLHQCISFGHIAGNGVST